MVMREAAGAGVVSPTPSAAKGGEQIRETNKENNEKETPVGDSGDQVSASSPVYKTVGENGRVSEKPGRVSEKPVSRTMDPNILDDVDGKPTVLNQTVDPPGAFCACCVVM
jgi:hypothetical protein